mgnify:CR=1 FL=1
MEFFIYVSNYAGGRLEFHFMVHALPGGLVIYIMLFYWRGLIVMIIPLDFQVVYTPAKREQLSTQNRPKQIGCETVTKCLNLKRIRNQV